MKKHSNVPTFVCALLPSDGYMNLVIISDCLDMYQRIGMHFMAAKVKDEKNPN